MARVDPVYLDHNATTPVAPAVRDAMLPWLGEAFGNPASAHAPGRAAAAALARARAEVAALVGAEPDEVVFTSGGTESDNLAVLGTQLPRPRIVASAVEHPAVEAALVVRERQGVAVERLAVDRDARVELERAAATLRVPAGLLTVMLAQNETGTIEPVAQLAALARAAAPDVIVHCDAAQAVGKHAVDMRALGVDLLTIVGHKFYAPAGIGALVVRRGTPLAATNYGGGQQRGLRSGTEPVALAVALGAACRLAASDLEQESARQRALRERLWQQLRDGIDGIVRTAADAPTLPGTLHVRVPGREGAAILAAAPAVAASTGSACHAGDGGHGVVTGVLAAMGVPLVEATGALRLSLGRSTIAADIDRAAAALVAACRSVPRH
ncbi:MAG: aminotransferase class V-fold PLP-dependent enzyme [Nannocystaceae bacterium]|nr:aminotransferase class V-fold PLP-dependent enzyme [Nannocystaceae bacterium]